MVEQEIGGRLDHLVKEDQRAPRDLQGSMAMLDSEETLVFQGTRAQKETQANQASLVLKDSPAVEELLVLEEKRVTLELLEPLETLVH